MNTEDVVQAVCLAIAAASAVALLLLRNPRSSLSRLVDRLDETTTDRKALR